ncbi:MAG TPA: alpha/beta hydrolase [Longimicrobiales bacterium]
MREMMTGVPGRDPRAEGAATGLHDDVALVLMHGAGLGAWIWRDVVPELSTPAIAVDFPARADPEARRALTFDDYVSHVEAQARELAARRIVLVAHSIAGVLAPRLLRALGERAAGLMAVSAVIPANGGSFLSALPLARRLPLTLILRLLGTRPPESAIRKGQCNDLDAATADEVVRRFAPESRALYTGSGGAELPRLPSLYVLLTADAELALPLQRSMAARLAAQTAEVAAGHLAMLSRPSALARVIDRFTARLTPE